MRFEVWAQTDVGLKRDINQDAILVDHDINLFVVADGMGGHKGGEVASALAVETVQNARWSRNNRRARFYPKPTAKPRAAFTIAARTNRPNSWAWARPWSCSGS